MTVCVICEILIIKNRKRHKVCPAFSPRTSGFRDPIHLMTLTAIVWWQIISKNLVHHAVPVFMDDYIRVVCVAALIATPFPAIKVNTGLCTTKTIDMCMCTIETASEVRAMFPLPVDSNAGHFIANRICEISPTIADGIVDPPCFVLRFIVC